MDNSSSSNSSFSINAPKYMENDEDKNALMSDDSVSTSLEDYKLFPELFDEFDISSDIECKSTNQNSTDLSQVYVENCGLFSLDDILDDLNNVQSTSTSSNSLASVKNDVSTEENSALEKETSSNNSNYTKETDENKENVAGANIFPSNKSHLISKISSQLDHLNNVQSTSTSSNSLASVKNDVSTEENSALAKGTSSKNSDYTKETDENKENVAGTNIFPSNKSRDSKQKKKKRNTYTVEQLKILEEHFQKRNFYLTRPELIQLINLTGLNEYQIKTWFQNRRAKFRKLQKATYTNGDGLKNNIKMQDNLKAASASNENIQHSSQSAFINNRIQGNDQHQTMTQKFYDKQYLQTTLSQKTFNQLQPTIMQPTYQGIQQPCNSNPRNMSPYQFVNHLSNHQYSCYQQQFSPSIVGSNCIQDNSRFTNTMSQQLPYNHQHHQFMSSTVGNNPYNVHMQHVNAPQVNRLYPQQLPNSSQNLPSYSFTYHQNY